MTTSPIKEDSRHSRSWCDYNPKDVWGREDAFELPRPKNFAIHFSNVLKKAEQLSLFIDIDQDILGGTPRICGTRIPVYMILNAIDEHGSVQGAANAYRSSLTEDEVRDALRFAVHVLESPIEHKLASID